MLSKGYDPKRAEPHFVANWQKENIYHFDPDGSGEVFSIDTPPPTVSGLLHLGHVYSYSHADFIARFWRMNGRRVFYPMGYDDNGLPTERLVEKRLGITAAQVGRQAFIEKCLQVSEEAEVEYQRLWQRLGLSVDWRYTYRTIDETSRRASQLSFLDLFQKGLAYQREAPAIWCPECKTSIAQAELKDLDRESEFVYLAFQREDGGLVPIATTRPELLAACVAVFVHPEDLRFQELIGQNLRVPLFGQFVPVLSDPDADPRKGSGVVMCCTFGDSTDVNWWYTHKLPLIEAIGRDGYLTAEAGAFCGMPVMQARSAIIATLQENGLVIDRQPTIHSVRVHERCDTPVEYVLARQWFVRVMEHKAELIEAGAQINWQPDHMEARYRNWVEDLSWDWCISRQRYYGVAFPVWYCQDCGQIALALEEQLPVDPSVDQPLEACRCGSQRFLPETDVMDTWATSSLTPQIVGQRLSDPQLYAQVYPFSLRPQAHEIIRTWAFYTIVKSKYHSDTLPWKNVLISGWGIAGEGMGKISKSRGGGPFPPLEMIERYSADAVRYWAASAGPGKDAVISEEKIQLGSKLLIKLWNVARFSERFLAGYQPDAVVASNLMFTTADRWILARLYQVINRVSELFRTGEYAAAKSEVESFFWRDLSDNYLEMVKQRLYDPQHPYHLGALYSLYNVVLAVTKMLAPFLPFITEEIYKGLFIDFDGAPSVHRSTWPTGNPTWRNDLGLVDGELLIEIATAVRRYKSERSLPLGKELKILQLHLVGNPNQVNMIEANSDLQSITRAAHIEWVEVLDTGLAVFASDKGVVEIGVLE